MISSVVRFSRCMVVLNCVVFIDSIVPVWVVLFCDIRVRARIPTRVIIRVSFESFILLGIRLCLCLLRCGLVQLLGRRICLRDPKL